MAGNDVYTVFLTNCDGADTSTTFTDSSVGGSTHTITAVADCQVDTAFKQFGTGSAMFDGTGDALTTANHADFDFGTGAFTIDFWIRRSTSDWQPVISNNTGDVTGMLIALDASGYVRIYIGNGSSWIINATSSNAVAINTWTHIAIVREGTGTNEFKAYVGGTVGITTTYSGTDIDDNDVLDIGRWQNGADCFTGHIDEFRISKGVARWTGNFTPPIAAYTYVPPVDWVRPNRMPRTTRDERFFVPVHYSVKHVLDPLTFTVTRQEDGSWLFSWTAGAAPFRIFLDGKLIDTVTTLYYEYPPSDYQDTPPPLEIAGAADEAETELYPAWATLQWRAAENADVYVAQQYIGSSWVDVNTQPEDRRGTYIYETPSLTDATAAQWRVVARDASGREGTPLAFTFKVNRNPPPPDVTYSASGGTLTTAAE